MNNISYKKQKIACITTVRTASTRLPGKALLTINGKRVIDHVIERMKSAQKPTMIILCTSDLPEDDILENIAREHGIECFRGSAKDRLARMLGAAEKFNLDYVVTFDADDPFCDPELIDKSIEQVIKNPCDVIKIPDGMVCGAFTFCISTETLRKACNIKDTTDTEMYENYILDRTMFKVRDLVENNTVFYNDKIRLTLDYQEDLNFFNEVFTKMNIIKNNFPLRDILVYLNDNPEIPLINISRHKDYIKKRELMKKKVKIKQ